MSESNYSSPGRFKVHHRRGRGFHGRRHFDNGNDMHGRCARLGGRGRPTGIGGPRIYLLGKRRNETCSARSMKSHPIYNRRKILVKLTMNR